MPGGPSTTCSSMTTLPSTGTASASSWPRPSRPRRGWSAARACRGTSPRCSSRWGCRPTSSATRCPASRRVRSTRASTTSAGTCCSSRAPASSSAGRRWSEEVPGTPRTSCSGRTWTSASAPGCWGSPWSWRRRRTSTTRSRWRRGAATAHRRSPSGTSPGATGSARLQRTPRRHGCPCSSPSTPACSVPRWCCWRPSGASVRSRRICGRTVGSSGPCRTSPGGGGRSSAAGRSPTGGYAATWCGTFRAPGSSSSAGSCSGERRLSGSAPRPLPI